MLKKKMRSSASELEAAASTVNPERVTVWDKELVSAL